MNACVTLQTPRLILRTVTMEDAGDVAAAWQLDDEPISLPEASDTINWMINNHEQNAPGKLVHLCLAVIHKETREFIGWCGLDHTERIRPNPVLFYLLKRRYWDKGLATEAAGAVIDYAFRELSLARIDSGAEYENIASKRVMEKIGLRYLGLDEAGDHSFTLAKDEYLQRHPSSG